MVKNSPGNARERRDAGLIPGSRGSPGGGAWQPSPVFLPGESEVPGQATIHRVTKSWTRLNRLST